MMYFLDPRVYELLPESNRPALAGFLNLVASQTHGKGNTHAMQKWFATRMHVSVRTIRRYESELWKLGLLVIDKIKGVANRRMLALGGALLKALGRKRERTNVSSCAGADVPSLPPRIYGARTRDGEKTSYKAAESGVNGALKRYVPDQTQRNTEPPSLLEMLKADKERRAQTA